MEVRCPPFKSFIINDHKVCKIQYNNQIYRITECTWPKVQYVPAEYDIQLTGFKSLWK